MYSRGEVIEINAATHQVRVRLPAKDDLSSPWLDVLVRSTHGDREYGLPKVGNQVACLLDERGESGCVLGAIYSEPDPTPEGMSATKRGMLIEDGARFEYDEEAGRFVLSLPSSALANLCGDAMKVALAELVAEHFDAWKSTFDGHTHAAGALAGGGPSPITGTTGAPLSPAPSTGELGSQQLRSS